MSKYSINQMLEKPELLNHNGCWNFFNWVGSSNTLEKRAKNLFLVLKFFTDHKILNGNDVYAVFRNRQMFSGIPFDEIRFYSMSSDEFLGGITPSNGIDKTKGQCYLWSFDGNKNVEEKYFSSFLEFKRQVKTNDSLVEELQIFYSY